MASSFPFVCPLCKHKEIIEFYRERDSFKRVFCRCEECRLIFLDPRLQLPMSLEKSRYENHNNSERTAGYENFLRTLIEPLKKYIKHKMTGLDFGCGPYPMLLELMSEDGYKSIGYDPYFFNHEAVLRGSYDYITSVEVVEHFNEPLKTFTLIDNMLRKGGILALKTSFYDDSIDFKNWYYVKDDTHISFYSIESMKWIAKHFNYEVLEVSDSVIFMRKLRSESE